MSSYPIMLKLTGKQAVVIGGGSVAARKAVHLLETEISVKVISPTLEPRLYKCYLEGKIEWLEREFEPGDLSNAMIVIAATNKKDVNQKISMCASEHQLLNVVDQPSLGNFHMPAKLSYGDLVIAVSTGGASPYLAKTIRDEISELYDQSMEAYLQFLTIVRKTAKENVPDIELRKQLLQEITHKYYRNSVERQIEFLERMLDFNEQTGKKLGRSH